MVREAGEEPGQPGVTGSRGRCFRREHSAGTQSVGSGASLVRPAVKTLHFHCRGHRLNTCWEAKIPHASQCSQKVKKKKKRFYFVQKNKSPA